MAHMFMSHTTGKNIWLELRGLPLIKFISGTGHVRLFKEYGNPIAHPPTLVPS